MSEIIFLISPSDNLLLLYRNAAYLWMLILHPANLLSSLKSASSIFNFKFPSLLITNSANLGGLTDGITQALLSS